MPQSMDETLSRGEALLHEDLITPLHDHDESRNRILAKVDGETRVLSPDQANQYAIAQRPNLGIDEVEPDPDGPKSGRRGLFKGTLIGLGGLLAASALPRYSFAATGGDLLICVFLRGGFDGLSAVGPVGDSSYTKARGELAITTKNKGKPLGTKYLLNPNLGALAPLWGAHEMAVVLGAGHPDVSRSHFEDQAMCERAAAANVRSGWLGRHIATSSATSGTFRAITIGSRVVLSLTTTAHQSLAMSTVEDFDLWAPWNGRETLISDLTKLYGNAGGVMETQVKGTLDAVNSLKKLRESTYKPTNGAKYPNTTFGRGMKDIARLTKAGIGLEVACIDYGGWDLHQNSGALYQSSGAFASMAKDLAGSIAALRTDLGTTRWKSVTLVTMSEFGRRVSVNGDGGTDHGHGNVQFIMGGSIKGGIYGSMPTLSKGNLTDGDVPITTDYRQALSEVVSKRLNNANVGEVFPGFTPGAPLGVA